MQPDEIMAMPGFQKMLMHLSEQGSAQVDNIEALAVESLQARLKALGKARLCRYASAKYTGAVGLD